MEDMRCPTNLLPSPPPIYLLPLPHVIFPKVSVVIPMYNAEEFIGECLDSLLIQTLQDFEVIVADDCSTDNSVKIVESYVEKFGGRLRITKTEKNSGGGGYVPRNIGLKLACGEYVIFLDSDDFLLGSALETLYNAAKEYDADVVYTGARYFVTAPNEIRLSRDGEGRNLVKQGLEDKPTLTINDTDKNIYRLFFGDNFQAGWTKFVRRDLLIKEKIIFPAEMITGGDYIWTIHVYCCSKRFLRLPVPVYFYRIYDDNSFTKEQHSPAEQISRLISAFIAFTKSLRQLENKHETLSKNPANCLTAYKNYFKWHFSRTYENIAQLSDQEIYDVLYREFSKHDDLPDNIIPFFMGFLYADKKNAKTIPPNFIRYITARIDVNLKPETSGGDFQILAVSDSKVSVSKPDWMQMAGIGYLINSYSGNIEFVAKTDVDGQFLLKLRGLDVRDPEDKNKRIPCWIDYIKLTVNGQAIFNTLTPAWHDKPYLYTTEVKADAEINIQVEWLPHNGKLETSVDRHNYALSLLSSYPIISVIIPMYNAEKYIGECLDSLWAQTFHNFELILVDDCSTDTSCKIVKNYIPKFNGRLRLYHTEKNSGSGAMPRNKGVSLSRGEYIKFVDSDDTLTKTALEELYTLAKKYDADVVYCEKYYMSTGVGEEFIKNIHLADERIQQPPFVHKPEFEPDDLSERVKDILKRRFWVAPWDKFIRRNLLVENEIFFPQVTISEDNIWSYGVIFYAKKILRVPNMVYIRRMNDDSVMGSEKTPHQTINFWLSPVLLGLKSLDNLMSKHEFFKTNPQQRYAVLRSLALTNLNLGFGKAGKLSSTEVYETIKQKFGKRLGDYDVLVSCLCTLICEQNKAPADKRNYKKLIEEKDAEISRLKEELNLMSYQQLTEQPAPVAAPLTFRPITCPISVIVSLYNYEKYIGECLDSIFAQTFQDFEVIVVDDCSTDNSVEVVKSYMSKFDGRLKLVQLETNSGGSGLPRNKGFELACGEYVFFMDADDVFIKTALEEMYTLAKEYDADVVYCEKYYMSTGVGEEFIKNIYLADERIQKPPFVDKPTLETEDFVERVNGAVMRRYWVTAWLRLVQRKLLVENNIRFDSLIASNDVNWTFKVLFCSKRFLRVPNICYIRRIHDESVSFRRRTPAGYVRKWMDRSIRSLKDMDNFLSKIEFFRDNPKYRNNVLNYFLTSDLSNSFKECKNLSRFDMYDIFHKSFSEYFGEHDVLFASLCAHIYDPGDWWGEKYTQRGKKVATGIVARFDFAPYLTARVDIKLMSTEGDFQILSTSDNKAKVIQPAWLQINGIGYLIQSYVGKLKFIVKATVDGKVQLCLRGVDVRDPEDNSKRIPHWIDYTKFTVNGKTIFDTLTPTWHDKPYLYNMNAKAGEEIKIELEWLPHRSELIADNFVPYITARADVKLMSTEGNFQILSVSDYFANVTRPAWFQKGGIGYQIESSIGMLEIVAKADVEGQVQLHLKGMDIRDPKDKSKRIPYWIDYTKLTVRGKTVFDTPTPTWHDKPYIYKMNAKAGEEFKIQIEWLPHGSND